MERAEFLRLCQLASAIKDKPKVVHNGLLYFPVGYKMTFKNGKAMHTAILKDLNANSVINADLGEVDIYAK